MYVAQVRDQSPVLANTIAQAFSISGPQAKFGPRDVADWTDNGLYSLSIHFSVVYSDFPLGYSLQ
jgi:hypothetical protein